MTKVLEIEPSAGRTGWGRGVLWTLWTLYRKFLISVLLFGIPAYMLSGFLAKLSGGALWLPEQWQITVRLFGTLTGFCFFNLARFRKRSDEERPPEPVVDKQGLTPNDLVLSPKQRAEARPAQWAALVRFAAALLFLLLYMGLRTLTAIPWAPRAETVETLWGDGSVGQGPRDVAARVDTSSFAAPVFLEYRGDGYHGAILVPPSAMLSPSTKRSLEFYAKKAAGPTGARGRPGDSRIDRGAAIGYWLDNAPNDLIDELRSDRAAIYSTVVLFLLLHLAVMCFASAGCGLTFSIVEGLPS